MYIDICFCTDFFLLSLQLFNIVIQNSSILYNEDILLLNVNTFSDILHVCIYAMTTFYLIDLHYLFALHLRGITYFIIYYSI